MAVWHVPRGSHASSGPTCAEELLCKPPGIWDMESCRAEEFPGSLPQPSPTDWGADRDKNSTHTFRLLNEIPALRRRRRSPAVAGCDSSPVLEAPAFLCRVGEEFSLAQGPNSIIRQSSASEHYATLISPT